MIIGHYHKNAPVVFCYAEDLCEEGRCVMP